MIITTGGLFTYKYIYIYIHIHVSINKDGVMIYIGYRYEEEHFQPANL